MRQIIAIICSFFVFFSFLEGKALVKETNDFAHAFTYLEDDTLFVFDLDNTLIETAQHLGSDQWFSHKLDFFVKEGLSLDEALNRVVTQLIEVQNRSEMRLVDPAIPDLLYKMQRKNVSMIGLTKREPRMSERTLKQLAPLHIDFSRTAKIKEELVFDELQGTTLKQGIIFVGPGIEKGPALMAYLKQLNKQPKKIVVIDDKMSHIQNIANVLEPLEITFIGIRYGGADEKVRAFNPKIADLQWEHFQKILSDEQALLLLQLENHPASIEG
jgi:FMN phosphatase YigB (HAD superfamily)